MKKKIIVLFCLLGLSFSVVFTGCSGNNNSEDTLSSTDYTSGNTSTTNNSSETDKEKTDKTKMPSTTDDATIHKNNVEIDTTPDSYTVLVNKEYGLPADYIPEDLVVPNIAYSFSYYDEKKQLRKVPAAALEELVNAASEEGLTIKGVSGYRSYARQKTIYNNNIRTQGLAHTEQYSAKPGYSEHQSGLSIDVSAKSAGYGLTARFGSTAEGKWLAKNCYKFGFIIRYPEGKEQITGYSYEPWHIRYVGNELAKYLTENNLTLDEYYNYTPSQTTEPDKGTEDYDLDDIPKATATPIAATSKPYRTFRPTVTPKATATVSPTKSPTVTKKPTSTPKVSPTVKPTDEPSAKPTVKPTVKPSTKPTVKPNDDKPSDSPTVKPTVKPTAKPTVKPTPSHGQSESTGEDSASSESEVN
ncbi:MAG: D-alanyl-D-alanine carboxypeptidase family protein [bacterium]|nr:D-alanyl-D-alanine carboxypeptidase family protein [bacterium]